jgi:hypothetical protein
MRAGAQVNDAGEPPARQVAARKKKPARRKTATKPKA